MVIITDPQQEFPPKPQLCKVKRWLRGNGNLMIKIWNDGEKPRWRHLGDTK